MRKIILTILTALMILTALSCCGQGDTAQLPKGFQSLNYTGDISFGYTLYSPEEGKELPVVIYFHGFGETDTVTETPSAEETDVVTESPAVREADAATEPPAPRLGPPGGTTAQRKGKGRKPPPPG